MAQQFGVDSGTLTATVGTEQVLTSSTAAAVFIIGVDLRDMLDGDNVELRAYTKVLTGDAQEYLAYGPAQYAHKQGDNAIAGVSASGGGGGSTIKFSIPIPSAYGIIFTLKQTAGGARKFPWRLDTL